MKRKFIYEDEKSNKFWEIELKGKSLSTSYGKVGGKPRTTIKKFGSDAETLKAYNQIIAEKIKKGYREISNNSAVPTTPNTIQKQNPPLSLPPEYANFKIPSMFDDFADTIRSTLKPSIIVELKGKPASPWSSKVGGNPYLPEGTIYPTSKKGKHLLFLAQINFSEVPALPDFPDKGILEFYIFDNDLYGLDLDNPLKSEFALLYFPEVIQDKKKLVTDFTFLRKFKYSPMETKMEAAMRFKHSLQPISYSDYRFEKIMPKSFQEDDLLEGYCESFGASGHRIGGYPEFTQEDPRGSRTFKGYELLFQLDSEDFICWGDIGVANFFIKPEDLQNKDFSKILYNWDCG